MSINLVLADDDTLIRESLKIILSSDKDINVTGCFEDGKSAVDFILNNEVDIALLDVRMPVLNGVEATKEISKRTKTKVIILTTFDEDNYIKDGIAYGAKGYLLKNTHPEKIIKTIHIVNDGNCVFQEEIVSKISNQFSNSSNTVSSIDKSKFTERELDVMKAIADGLSNKEISQLLFISEGTVKNYITSIFQKTGLEHRTQIAIYYIKGHL